ncbi:sulfotransferase domain-containing protein [Thiorhodococcus minor]|uniref:Sulfotransferase domain-containing protein n=1 Tax=Thiorhodococcus minor TaxID=57489 RepID=A0A6M0K1Q0_9GAMM|nr:sulfotransferase domain-containing protein [Thiorhodococcus minor]NEV62833.1 sulfotransferase domain-containing protein [Thiorhodococcus minor]
MGHPLFIGIGAQKCASTWLYDILRDHPGVTLSCRKELDFFSYHYGRGLQWYLGQFPSLSPGRLAGEISPSYFASKDVPARVKAFAPDAKILVSLRDPVERAISNHRHEVRLGSFSGPDVSFEAGLANNPMYLEQSRYGTHLQRWLEHFDESQTLILLQEDIERDPVSIAKQVYSFLGIAPAHRSSALHARSNESHLYRSRALESTRRGLRGTVRALHLDGLWGLAQRAGLQAAYRRLNRRPPAAAIPPVAEVTKQRLRETLEEEIRSLERLLGRELPHWRTGEPAAWVEAGSGGGLHEGRSAADTDADGHVAWGEPAGQLPSGIGGMQ